MRNRSVSRWDPGVREEGARPKLHVMILYDDVVAGQRAMELFAYLTHEHEKEIELRPQIWRLDLALDPDWRDFLDEEARRATLFIIAMSGESSLQMN